MAGNPLVNEVRDALVASGDYDEERATAIVGHFRAVIDLAHSQGKPLGVVLARLRELLAPPAVEARQDKPETPPPADKVREAFGMDSEEEPTHDSDTDDDTGGDAGAGD